MKLVLITAVAFYYVVCQADGAAWNEPSVMRGGRPNALLNKKKEQALQKKAGLFGSDREKPSVVLSKAILTKINESIEGLVSTLVRIKETVDVLGWTSISKLIKSFINGFNDFMDDLKSDYLRNSRGFRGSLGPKTSPGD